MPKNDSKNVCSFGIASKYRSTDRTLNVTHPEYLQEWDYEKNEISPWEITAGSEKKVWWKCKKGHNYYASVVNRVNLGRGCPYCSGKKVLKGYNDLATVRPEILKYWDYEKNVCNPSEITVGCSRKFWFRCENGHSRLCMVHSYKVGSCPYCNHCRTLKRIQNIETQMIFDSFEDAARYCGLKQGDTISLCCRGKQDMAGGYHWKFLDT